MSLDIFFNCQNSIRAHVGHTAFATLKIELYRVVDYDSKWSTKFHKDCILDFLFNFQNSIRVHVQHKAFATLQIELYSVVNYDSRWSAIFHMDCMLDFFIISPLRRLMERKKIKIVLEPMSGIVFETLQIKLYCAVEYDSMWSTKIHKDCMLDVFVISLLRRLKK